MSQVRCPRCEGVGKAWCRLCAGATTVPISLAVEYGLLMDGGQHPTQTVKLDELRRRHSGAGDFTVAYALLADDE